ncbi:unnamed protein product, partial [Ectocarpus sp. 12 AP-2014]
ECGPGKEIDRERDETSLAAVRCRDDPTTGGNTEQQETQLWIRQQFCSHARSGECPSATRPFLFRTVRIARSLARPRPCLSPNLMKENCRPHTQEYGFIVRPKPWWTR